MKKRDSGDRDAIDILVASDGWKLYRERLLLTRSQLIAQLIQPQTEAKTAELRGQILGIGLAAELPAILAKEASKAVKDAETETRR